MRRPALALILAASIPLAACAATAAGTLPRQGEVAPAPAKPQAGSRAIPFDRLRADLGAAGTDETRLVIISEAGYREHLGPAAPGGIDWPESWVVFYSAGTKPTGGYEASIESIRVAPDGVLEVVTRLVSPGQGCVATMALTRPHVLVRIRRPAESPRAVRFLTSDATRDCDPAGEAYGPMCGGIAAIPCPGAGTCVDDPRDDCDPRKGGADCSGVCRCLAQGLCVEGHRWDSSPEVCACVAAP